MSYQSRNQIVCLCGSTKFKTAYRAAERDFALAGVVVLSVGLFGHADSIPLTVGQKTSLDELHRRKIELATEIYVLNVDGYIGESTASEIAYADSLGKRISYLEEPLKSPAEMSLISRVAGLLARNINGELSRQKAAAKGQLTKTKRRIANGVCPCCNRTFADLAAHMHGQHPEYGDA